MKLNKEHKVSLFVLILYLLILVTFSNFTSGLHYLGLWLLITILFTFLANKSITNKTSFIDDSKYNRILIIISILIISICIRLLFHLSDNPLLNDLPAYSTYAGNFLSGLIPYKDFSTVYGPVFYYFIFVISWIFSPSPATMGAAFTLMDAMIPILVIYIALEMGYDFERSAGFGLLYAINPLSMTEIGWGGHMDSLLVFFLLISILFHLKGKETLAPVTLGITAAVKWFPVLLAPIFMRQYLNDHKKLAGYLFIVSIGFIASSLFFLIYAPKGFIHQILTHLTTGANISTLYSFQYYIAENSILFGAERATQELIEKVVTIILYITALSCLADYFFNGNQVIKRWYKVAFLQFGLYGILVAEFFILKFHTIDLYHLVFLLFPVGLIISSISAIDKLYKEKNLDKEFNDIDILLVVINLLIFTISTHYSWYYLWVMPLALLMNKRIRPNMIICILLSQPIGYMYIPFFPVS